MIRFTDSLACFKAIFRVYLPVHVDEGSNGEKLCVVSKYFYQGCKTDLAPNVETAPFVYNEPT